LKALVVLTSSECKRLIGMGVAALPEIKMALKSGLIVIIKGTTNSYVAEEILGKPIDKANFRRGVVLPGLLGGSPPPERRIPDVIIEKGEVSNDPGRGCSKASGRRCPDQGSKRPRPLRDGRSIRRLDDLWDYRSLDRGVDG